MRRRCGFRATLDGHLVDGGRSPEEVMILALVSITLADSRDAAIAQREAIVNAMPLEAGGIYMSHKSGFDFSTLPDRFTIGEAKERIEAKQGSTAYLSKFRGMDLDTKLSRDDLCELGRQAMLGGKPALMGTPDDVADQLEQLHEEAGPGIGFIFEVKHRMPGFVYDLCEKVVPILQKRGLCRTDYDGSLRENLGLADRSDRISW